MDHVSTPRRILSPLLAMVAAVVAVVAVWGVAIGPDPVTRADRTPTRLAEYGTSDETPAPSATPLTDAYGVTAADIRTAIDTPPTSPAPMAEDDPGWSCETMGNGVCGPVTAATDGEGVVIVDGGGVPLAFVPWEDVVACDSHPDPASVPGCRAYGYGVGN